MVFENPKQGEMIITRTTEGAEEHVPIRFISAVTNTIVRDVYAVETVDENEDLCFVVESSKSHDYGKDSPPQGIISVAYSLRRAEKMAYDYIKNKSEEIRSKHYSNHTLVDKVKLDSIE